MTTAALTPSEMTFLIGSKFLPNAEITDPRIVAAVPSLKGDGTPLGLAVRTIAGALLGLREEGTISMEYVEAKKLGIFTSRHVMITSVGTTSFPAESIEATLASAAGKGPTTVTRLVERWFGPRVKEPAVQAYTPVLQSLIASGLIVTVSHDVDRNKAAAVLTGHKTKTVQNLEPNREAIAGVVGSLAGWAERWTSFKSSDSVVADKLIFEARLALNNKVESDDTD